MKHVTNVIEFPPLGWSNTGFRGEAAWSAGSSLGQSSQFFWHLRWWAGILSSRASRPQLYVLQPMLTAANAGSDSNEQLKAIRWVQLGERYAMAWQALLMSRLCRNRGLDGDGQ